MSEFPQESEPPQEPAMWVEVRHPSIAPPPHTEFRSFSPAGWIRSHQSLARVAALALAVISTALLGLAAWMQPGQDQAQAVFTQSATSEPLLARPVVTPRPTPPVVFTSRAAAPPTESASTLPPARGGASGRAEGAEPVLPLVSASRGGASTPPARTNTPPLRVTAPPQARVTGPASRGATASSPSSRGVAPARPADVKVLQPDMTSAASAALTSSKPAVEPAASPVPTPAAAPPPPPPSPEAREIAAVESVIERYRLAFSLLNSAVNDFWPSVNSRALDKAFNDLERQRFEFDQCRVQIKGAQADATCAGRATFVPKVGNKTPRTQPRQWFFSLVRAGNRWIIDSVQSR